LIAERSFCHAKGIAREFTSADTFHRGFDSKVLSFSPGFSPVQEQRKQRGTVSTVFLDFAEETVKTVTQLACCLTPG
jgi:hypothetical protein